MPVPAKFSREFYDSLGHRVADELIDWFKTVDTTYRTEFRELFDTRFNQLDGKLEQRTAELRQEMAELKGELRQEMGGLRQEMVQMRGELRQEMVEMRGDLRQQRTDQHAQIAGLREAMASQEARLVRWGLALWITSLGVITAVIRFSV